MRRAMIRYRVKADCAEENEKLIAAVFKELELERPSGLRYMSLKHDDGVTFVHFVSREGDSAGNPLTELNAFKSFVAGVKKRCVEPPIAMELTLIGAYGFTEI
ncbi:MAG: hypothetical protein ABI036_19425 [Fibrobacteria bacterium]